MKNELVIKPDKWCTEQVIDALLHADATAVRINDYWFPTAAKIEVSKHYISTYSEGLRYNIILYPDRIHIATRHCTLIIYQDEMHLVNHVAQITEKGKYIYINQQFYYTGKELYSVEELRTKIRQIFEKVINAARHILDSRQE
jgi:hypothetical protein